MTRIFKAGENPLLDMRSRLPALRELPRLAIQALRRDAILLIVTMIGSSAIRFISTMILTRLLSPEIFGAVGIIMSLFFIMSMLTDLGFQNFIVRHPRGLERRFLDVLWTTHLLRGFALTAVGVAIAWPLALFTEKDVLFLPIVAASATFAISGFASLSLLTALRTGLVGRLCLLELGLILVQTVLTIAFALITASIWAIVLALILQACLRTALSYALFPEAGHSLRFDRQISREFWSFSKVILLSSSLSVVLTQADKVVLAKIFPIETFGLYTIAATLAAVPFTFVSAYVSKLVYPRYAEAWLQSPETIARTYYTIRYRISLVYAFLAGGLIGSAPLVIAILYDDRYKAASLFLTILAISPALVLTNVSATEFLIAIGRTRATVYANLSRVAWLLAIGAAGFVNFGPLGVVVAAGSMEIAPYLVTSAMLRRVGVLDLRLEAVFISLSILGALIGYGTHLMLTPYF